MVVWVFVGFKYRVFIGFNYEGFIWFNYMRVYRVLQGFAGVTVELPK